MVHPLDLAVIVVYLVVVVAVGLAVSRKVHDARNYFLRASLTWVVIGLSIIGTNVDAGGYVGVSGGASTWSASPKRTSSGSARSRP